MSLTEPILNDLHVQCSGEPAGATFPLSDPAGARNSGGRIQLESRWRTPPQAVTHPDSRRGRLALSRWVGVVEDAPIEVTSDAVDDAHVMTLVLRRTRADLAIAGRRVGRGNIRSGAVFLTGPKASTWQATFYMSYDHLRAHLPQSMMAECYEAAFGRPPPSAISLLETCYSDDPILRNIARTLGNFEAHEHVVEPSFLDALGLALASRLICLGHGRKEQPAGNVYGALAKWRLDRVIDYIEAHLLRPIGLAELSEVAGLSRMYFAAQFREATGYAPHTYILHRKVLRAQQLLLNPEESIVNVALSMGFSSQAHFTEAFRRAVGEPPARWRRSRLPGVPA